MHFPAYSFVVKSTSFNCAIVTSYNQCLVTHHVTFMFNLFNPPPQKLQKIYKKFKVSKKYSKKPKNPSKNFFPLDWVPTKLMALFQYRNFNFGICSDKDAFIKEVSSSLPILSLFKNCFNDVSLAVREFSLAIDFSSWWLTNQNWLSLMLSSTWKIESHHFF